MAFFFSFASPRSGRRVRSESPFRKRGLEVKWKGIGRGGMEKGGSFLVIVARKTTRSNMSRRSNGGSYIDIPNEM